MRVETLLEFGELLNERIRQENARQQAQARKRR